MNIDMFFLSLLNGSDSIFADELMIILTNGITWVGLYLALAFLVIKNNKTVSQILLIFACALVCVLLSGILNDMVFKPLFHRLRPVNDPDVKDMVTVVSGYYAKGYSFFSSHSANTFSLSIFFTLLIRSKLIGMTLFSWAFINAFTRLYLGVHWFSDVMTGMVWGLLIGVLAYYLYYKVFYIISPHAKYISSQYTSTGYSHNEIDLTVCVYVFTIIYCIISAVVS